MRWRVHFWAGRIAGCALLLFFLKEPILGALPDPISALAPERLGAWLLGVVGACVALRWSIWAYTYRNDPHEYVTIRCAPPLNRVTVRVQPPSR